MISTIKDSGHQSATYQRELLGVIPLAITGANSVGAGDAAVASDTAAERASVCVVTDRTLLNRNPNYVRQEKYENN